MVPVEIDRSKLEFEASYELNLTFTVDGVARCGRSSKACLIGRRRTADDVRGCVVGGEVAVIHQVKGLHREHQLIFFADADSAGEASIQIND